MYVWEMIACRLRGEGWSVWHVASQNEGDWAYTVHYHRPGVAGQAVGPTLTEAYAAAARRAHQSQQSPAPGRYNPAPHFALYALAQ